MLTTGQAARMCGCAPRTICTWFDAGYITGAVLPDSGYRKISEESLAAFAKEHGIELIPLEDLECKATGTKRSPTSPKGSSRLPRRRTKRPPS